MSRDLSRWRRMLAVNLWCVMVLATSVFAAESSSQAPAVKQIKLATLEWPPYVGKKLKQQGYVHEVVVTALERVGYEVQIQYVPWPRALREVSLGEIGRASCRERVEISVVAVSWKNKRSGA